MSYRPGGVTALSVILIIFGALGVIAAVAIEYIAVAGYQSSIAGNIFGYISFMMYISYYITLARKPPTLVLGMKRQKIYVK